MNRLVVAAAGLLGLLVAGLRRLVVGREHAVETRTAARRPVRLDALLVEQVDERVPLARRRRGDLLLVLDRRGRLLDVLGRDRRGRRFGDGPLHLLGAARLPLLLFLDTAVAGGRDLVVVQTLLRADHLVLPLELLVDRCGHCGACFL